MLASEHLMDNHPALNGQRSTCVIVIGVTEQQGVQLGNTEGDKCRMHDRFAKIEPAAQPCTGIVEQAVIAGLNQRRGTLPYVKDGYPASPTSGRSCAGITSTRAQTSAGSHRVRASGLSRASIPSMPITQANQPGNAMLTGA